MKKIIDNSETGKRSIQNLSNNWLGSTDFGRLVPIYWKEMLGTDHVKSYRPRIELQMLPLVSPTFGEMDVYVHAFFVPTRLLWDSFNDFYSQSGENKDDEPPYMIYDDFIWAYLHNNLDNVGQGNRPVFKHWTSMGLPPFFDGTAGTGTRTSFPKISTLPFRAYNQIWWDFYRDTELLRDESKSQYLVTSGGHEEFTELGNERLDYVPRQRTIKDLWISDLFAQNGISPGNYPVSMANFDGYTEVVTASDNVQNQKGSTSSKLRYVEAVTRLAERMSLSGKRQIDMLYSQYGIKPEFSKLSMCQYLGGARERVLVGDITATATNAHEDGSTVGTALGQKAGSGYCQLSNLDIEFTAHEPGYFMVMLSVMPRVHFVQGLSKEWIKYDRFDWFRRELEHVGQVAVPKSEVSLSYHTRGTGSSAVKYVCNNAQDGQTFAFTQPFYDYKMKQDVLAGDFMWYHLPSSLQTPGYQDFDISYMQSMGLYIDYPTSRTYNIESLSVPASHANQIFYYRGGDVWSNADDHFFVNVNNDCVVDRPMDGYAVPTLETTEDPHVTKAPVGQSLQL